jgi:Calcineurin-like phosphoesterase
MSGLTRLDGLPRAAAAAAVAGLLLLGCRTATYAGAAAVQPAAVQPARVSLPDEPGALEFAVIGDFGTGGSEEYAVARELAAVHERVPFQLVITVGDNLYGSERPQDFVRKFEEPFKALLDAGVVFRASLGNHDSREQRSYEPFHMNGQLYYTFSPQAHIRFFALESSYMTPDQVAWFEKALQASNDDWKIAYFHHPLYSSARRHGSDLQLRSVLEPLLVKYNVSVVFSGHDHVYERMKPQKGIVYFVVGSGGQLRGGDIDRSDPLTAKGFDSDRAFLVAEIQGDRMRFEAVSRTGEVVDSGTIMRRMPAAKEAP